MIRPTIHTLVALLLLLISLPVITLADIAPTLNYQGRLTDNAGSPVADGSYDLFFRIYTDAAGGSLLWNSGGSPVSVSTVNGLFNVILGDASMDALPEQIFSGQMLFLEIEIDGEPPFVPRQPIVATAYSLRANFAEDAQNAQFLGGLDNSSFLPITGGTMTGQLTINILGGGEEFLFLRGSSTGSSVLQMFHEGDPRIVIIGTPTGGVFRLVDEDGDNVLAVQANLGLGGTLDIRNSDAAYGISFTGGNPSIATSFELTADGSAGLYVSASVSDPQPNMLFTDQSGIPQIELDPGNANSGSKVYLPAQSIDGYEIADGAIDADHIHPAGLSVDNLDDDVGGSQNVFPETTEWFLTGNGPASIIAGGLMAPADGFVLAICSFQLDVLHVSGTKSEAVFGLSDDPPNLLGDQTHTYTRWPSITSGTFGDIISIQRIFPVEEGVNRIWLVGEKTSGVNPHIVTDVTMSVLYFKKDYGLTN